MLAALILFPLFFAALAFLLPWYQGRSWMLPLAGTLHLLLASFLVVGQSPVAAPGAWIGLDSLSKIVLLATSLLFCSCAFYAVDYLKLHRARGNKVMAPCLLIFLSAMTLAVVARHLGVLWMAVETTTLASAPLIYYNRNRLSIEATWKYLLICSVGIALAMFGILFIAYSALGGAGPATLQFDRLLAAAPSLASPWLHAGFVFLLVGFGTKMGLAPLHTWKPDAYGEAPAVVGALLAGGLTSVAFLAIVRGVQLMGAAGDLTMARHALLGMGLLSLLLAAVFMVRQPDIKRMLAYSSVEHMGILAIGVGIGGLATYGALLHLVNNALTKGCLFLSAGNIQRAFASKNLSEVRGAIAAVPVSGTLFLVGFLAITGSPPFGLFMSEFTILRGIFSGGHTAVGVAFLSLLAMIFIGMGATVLAATQGETTEKKVLFKDRFLLVAPPLVLILVVLLLGLYIPEPLRALLQNAANLLEGKS
ncbi:Ech hydrogenase-like complex, HyfF-like integral membrane subunit [Desulfuromonas soudanensis]|uniref:Ech hydrogenase-like complex, HyfF-like integral membrane subunit n=1 Tax=Desulfuromonas soudanensis TaxID=1603606 RepID=A0A0M4CZG8_9BACT|nr:proton-conducting transporter membrane subunit [Desulfuromonas soudanensis]ALC15915.1 Ech hydrogenase-like complex, HyfF-like integral membrane subunit [Desulfuromonas soudanensis]